MSDFCFWYMANDGCFITYIIQGQYSWTRISKDQIKFEQKWSTFDQTFGSTMIGIHETFDLIFWSNFGLNLIYVLCWINFLIKVDLLLISHYRDRVTNGSMTNTGIFSALFNDHLFPLWPDIFLNVYICSKVKKLYVTKIQLYGYISNIFVCRKERHMALKHLSKQ